MTENTDSGCSQRDSLLFHGRCYGIIINAKNKENLTASPDGVVGSDSDATYIRDLSKKKIKTIKLLTCSNGILDAINYEDEITTDSGTFAIKGNVAQAFLDSQDVDMVKAWDGALGYRHLVYTPRLSFNQSSFRKQLKWLKKNRVVIPKRGTYYYAYGLFYVSHTGSNKPCGSINYKRNEDGGLTCCYSYIKQFSNLVSIRLKITETVDINDLS